LEHASAAFERRFGLPGASEGEQRDSEAGKNRQLCFRATHGEALLL
jgi:hypothetical protein